ncbi:ribose ABC transporter substrate-binding protein RbsB [Clostridium sp. MSJ-11]|uniref:Ribose ABC transporter substrate-binding protein RbsB n=1 Tax=Clostridium mobile TaxID=2841512 RepID=A0ABS6EMT4_9CLOT|nr:ribose ABC transporter substrate-binding protein RbsB [Clostridium mobile]MBU5486541.1 ribose ABC transporter substrate-binding protein RbsB [Clostridium mobile]
MKKRNLKILALALAGVLITAGFLGCTKSEDKDSASKGEESKKIGMVISTLNNPFFVTMKEGAEKKAKELGYELIVLDSRNDGATERSNVEDLIQKGAKVIIVNPTDSDAVGNAIKVANDSKIPVVTVDRNANSGEVASHIASDNVAGGKLAAEFIIEKLGEKGNVVEIQGLPGTSAARDRGKGFHDGLSGKDGVKVVASQPADFDRQKGLSVMENIIQAHPDFQAVFCHNDEMALGAAKALIGKEVIVVGFDGNDDAVKAVESGEIAATIAQQPDLMGSISIENAVKILKGENVEKEIPVELKLIKK